MALFNVGAQNWAPGGQYALHVHRSTAPCTFCALPNHGVVHVVHSIEFMHTAHVQCTVSAHAVHMTVLYVH